MTRMNTASRSGRLLGGAALGVIAALCGTSAYAAAAAPASGPAEIEELVVTGTSIRGVAPVGANVVSVGREEIKATGAQTVQQLLASVPQVTGFNNQAQGGFGSADGSGTNAPTIHSLGASASNGTLVLIDGHRLPLSGLNHTLADPSVIAPAALERVEVLPEGSSAVYGSDAVAGVLNFITRRRYDGLETSAQLGVGDEYHTANFNMVWGSVWDTGSALFAYGYSYQSDYQNGDRKWWKTDLRPQGGANFNNFNCSPAAIQPGTSGGNFFLAPYTGTGIVQTNTQGGAGVCNFGADDDAVPEVVRHSVLGKFEQKLGEKLTLSADLVYSQRQQKEDGGAGNLTNVTVWGPGSTPPGGAGQINPFFQGPTGATVERINYSFDQLLPPSVTKAGAETKFITIGAEYELGRDWIAEFGGTFGQDDSYQRQLGVLCSSCAILALNGTNQTGGSVTTNSQVPVLGTNIIATRLPLTTANALDVWNPVGSNRTSAAVLENLRENRFQLSRQNIENVKATIGGPVFDLPAGPIRASFGAEGVRYSLRQFNTGSANLGNTAQNARFTNLDYSRDVYAFFGETVIPVIGPDAPVGPIERLNLSGAVRYDHYSDFGSTTNPKIAATMDIVGGLSFRGGWGTSFTAPALTSRGNERGITGESSVATLGAQTLPLSIPGARSLPGCATATGTTCQIGGNNPAQGIQVNGGNAALRPQEGESWSVGVDWRPEFFRGFSLSLTYWDVIANGLITAPNFNQVTASPALSAVALVFNPTQAQINDYIAGLPQNSVLPSRIDVIYSFQQRNVSNLKAGGIDFDARYRTATGVGDFVFSLAGSYKVKFDQQLGAGTPFLSRLNTAGLNTTFSSLRLTGRANVAWSNGPWRASGSANYTNPYWLRSNDAIRDFGARGQRVKKFLTFDANVSYEFEDTDGMMSGLSLTLNARNLFNQAPPFANQNGGFSTADATGLGRVVTFNVTKEW